MKYVLEEFLSSKSKEQIIKILAKKFKVDSEAQAIVLKYSGIYDYENDPKYKKLIDKACEDQYDCFDWLRAAYPSFSPEYWDDMVIKAGGCLECYGYSALND